MGTEIILKTDNLPAHVKGKHTANKAFMSGIGGAGYPFLSIEGKNWTVVRSDGKKRLSHPKDPEISATYVDIVLIAANPNKSKVFYAGGYEKGSNAKPTCVSDNGTSPNDEVVDKQSKSCANCKHRVYGTGMNGKGFACRETRRVAIVPSGQLNDPMLLRVPPTSLPALAEYVGEFDKRGLDVTAAITRIKFDEDEPTPKLVFKHIGWLDEDACEEVAKQIESDMVKQIIGALPTPSIKTDVDGEPPAKPAKAKVTEEDIEAALDEAPKKPASKMVDDDDDEPVKPKKPAAKKESKAVVSDSLDADLESVLDTLDA